MKLSVLDQSPISMGETPEIALQHTLELAKWTEELGYHRYWVAEHHNTNGLSISAPEIVMTRIASVTSRIRVGSGGILLPQYSPYKIAEIAKTLAAFFPDRIDLGVGNSPGGSPQTRAALTDNQNRSLAEFPRQVADLQGFLHNSLPRQHDFRLVKATPRIEQVPPLWLLGLSERSANRAGELGTGFIFGHFINPENGVNALQTYRENFSPSVGMEDPASIVCVFIVCAETEEEAEEHAMTQDKWLLNVSKGLGTKVTSIEDVRDDQDKWSAEDREIIKKNRERCIIGTQETVKQQLIALQEKYQTDEFMVINNIFDFEAKKKSYRLLAEAMR
ncbi:LLM class flavin-dependent oxidoreductase [Oceanobacillus jeddahense]|uniref:LLM class flavin-dependent oxidoreductase n=1 Tax=Oceanobacillus jeddahense TaxID=1462527 RepID=A0ABY5JUK2_9BACI|nr:LLM class flavin-dependent oxidoreductase [Oceanobacillus jeddahense]UUI04037.1 LLM class flavin-dependent oxidoreductase [Oceanobacillus jeddahense]